MSRESRVKGLGSMAALEAHVLESKVEVSQALDSRLLTLDS